MWALSYAIFLGCKWLTWRSTPFQNVSCLRQAAYLFAWPGFDAKAFIRPSRTPLENQPSAREWSFATAMLSLGLATFWGIGQLVPPGSDLLLGWGGMVGLVLILHFGSFHLLSCAWRQIGVDAQPLMNNPLRSTSVGEFWGKRWNTAFRDLTHTYVFLPLARKLGPRPAIIAGFAFSGLVHELAISVPASAGYGWPTLFFMLQSFALLLERSRFGSLHGLGRGLRGRAWTAIVVVLPAFGLFHPPFVSRVIVPFMKACGAA